MVVGVVVAGVVVVVVVVVVGVVDVVLVVELVVVVVVVAADGFVVDVWVLDVWTPEAPLPIVVEGAVDLEVWVNLEVVVGAVPFGDAGVGVNEPDVVVCVLEPAAPELEPLELLPDEGFVKAPPALGR